MLTRPASSCLNWRPVKPLSDDHKTEGPEFGTGSFSGMSNNTTLFGGVLAANGLPEHYLSE